jgi:hypothetical protein
MKNWRLVIKMARLKEELIAWEGVWGRLTAWGERKLVVDGKMTFILLQVPVDFKLSD